jgi:hypothetical protein
MRHKNTAKKWKLFCKTLITQRKRKIKKKKGCEADDAGG